MLPTGESRLQKISLCKMGGIREGMLLAMNAKPYDPTTMPIFVDLMFEVRKEIIENHEYE